MSAMVYRLIKTQASARSAAMRDASRLKIDMRRYDIRPLSKPPLLKLTTIPSLTFARCIWQVGGRPVSPLARRCRAPTIDLVEEQVCKGVGLITGVLGFAADGKQDAHQFLVHVNVRPVTHPEHSHLSLAGAWKEALVNQIAPVALSPSK